MFGKYTPRIFCGICQKKTGHHAGYRDVVVYDSITQETSQARINFKVCVNCGTLNQDSSREVEGLKGWYSTWPLKSVITTVSEALNISVARALHLNLKRS